MTAPEPTPTAEHIDAVARALNPAAFSRYASRPTWDFYRARARDDARAILNPTDPAVHAAMLDALVRAGVLTEFRIDARLNEDGSLTTDAYIEHCNVKARQFVTPWEVAP